MPVSTRSRSVLPAAFGLLLLAACTSSSPAGGTAASATRVDGGGESVMLTGTAANVWSPRTITAAPGVLTVQMVVPGGTPHNFQIEGVPGSKIALISNGERREIKVTLAPGTYTFVCTIHTGMDGTIVVGNAAPTPSASTL